MLLHEPNRRDRRDLACLGISVEVEELARASIEAPIRLQRKPDEFSALFPRDPEEHGALISVDDIVDVLGMQAVQSTGDEVLEDWLAGFLGDDDVAVVVPVLSSLVRVLIR